MICARDPKTGPRALTACDRGVLAAATRAPRDGKEAYLLRALENVHNDMRVVAEMREFCQARDGSFPEADTNKPRQGVALC